MKTNRRSFIKGVVSGGIANRSVHGSANGELRPNFVVILSDDMRWDALGAAGNQMIHTPNLDALAAEGTLFTNNFVTTSICPTSRVSILIGQYARRHNIWDFKTPLSDEQFRLSYTGLLRQAGYQTAFVGKWGLGGPMPESEFDYWRGFQGQGDYFDPTGEREEHLTGYLGRQATEFLESAHNHGPFCVAISFKAPHGPMKPDSKFAHLYEDLTIPHPPTSTNEHFEGLPAFIRGSQGRKGWKVRYSNDELYQYNVKQYYRLVTGLDDAVGNLVSFLKKKSCTTKPVSCYHQITVRCSESMALAVNGTDMRNPLERLS